MNKSSRITHVKIVAIGTGYGLDFAIASIRID
jgi:hypothetical protein